jgi:antitoxin component YwqK of YwqJK toxin-antitoxin module
MKTFILLLNFTAITILVNAQDKLHKVVVKNKATQKKEIYYTQSIDSDIKQGTYTLKNGGQVKAKGEYKENVRNGEWQFFQGPLHIKGTYVNGAKDSEWFYIKNQDTICILNYLANKMHGEQIGYYKNNIKL